MSDKERIPSDDWSLDELGQFCVAQDKRMALDAWMTGKAMFLAKERCNKEKESFTSWKSQHGFSHTKVSRYMRLFAAFSGDEDRKRLSELGIMDALREVGITAAKKKNAEMDGNEQSVGDGAEDDSEPSGAWPNAPVLAHVGTPSAVLIVMIDADKGSTDDRHRQLARSLSDANVQARNANEPIVVLVPKRHVETAAQAVWKGRRLLTPVGGGVIVRPRNALKTSNLLADEDGRVAAAHEGVDLSKLPKDKWWWDAK